MSTPVLGAPFLFFDPPGTGGAGDVISSSESASWPKVSTGGGGGGAAIGIGGGGGIGIGVVIAAFAGIGGGGGGGGGANSGAPLGRLLVGGGGTGPVVRGMGGGGAPGTRLAPGSGAAKPSNVFCRVIEGGGGTRDPGGGGTLGIPAGRDFFVASPSKMSRSELALSLISVCLLL
jgi:hypothetical protein